MHVKSSVNLNSFKLLDDYASMHRYPRRVMNCFILLRALTVDNDLGVRKKNL